MSGPHWYQRNPSDFLAGAITLDVVEKGVYATMIDLMYLHWSPLPDEPKDLARICGCTTRRFGQVRDRLIALGKLIRLPDGRLTNDRFERERLKIGQKIAKNLEKNGGKIRADLFGIKGLDSPIPRILDSQESVYRRRTSWPENFRDAFWKLYPLRVSKRPAIKALEKIHDADEVEWHVIVKAIERYAAWLREPRWRPRAKHPATWLNGECWNDELPEDYDHAKAQAAGRAEGNGAGAAHRPDAGGAARRTTADNIVAGMGSLAREMEQRKRERQDDAAAGGGPALGPGADVDQGTRH